MKNMSSFKGKVVGGAAYAHVSAIDKLEPRLIEISKIAAEIICKDSQWNVIKFNLKDKDKLSLLLYEDFEKSEFPALRNSETHRWYLTE